MLNGTDLTRLLDRRDRRSHDSALQSTPCRFAPGGRIPSPRGEGGFGIGQTWAIPKTDEGKMSQIFAWFPLISQRLVPRRCQLPPQGEAMAPSAREQKAHTKHTDFHPACVRSLGDFQRVPRSILGSRRTQPGRKTSKLVHLGHLLT